jgi:YesN/AraC family two-component response regulator
MSVLTHLQLLAKNKKVLIVDDDEQIVDIMADILKKSFGTVVTAYNGKEALEKYTTDKFDLVITDIRMPKMDGIELSIEIRRLHHEQAIIVASAHSDSEYLMDLISLGINDFILKPIDMTLFYKKIIKVLEYELHKKELERLRFKQFASLIRNGSTNSSVVSTEEKLKVSKSRHQQVLEEIINYDVSSTQEEIKEKVSAQEFMDKLQEDKEIWEILQSQMEEIILLGDDFEEYVNSMLLTGIDANTIEQVAVILQKYYHIFIIFDDFKSTANVFEEIANILMQIDASSLDDEKAKALEILEYIWEDIKNFVNGVFIKKDVTDVFFFEQSIKATAQQLKLGLGLVENNENMEFF